MQPQAKIPEALTGVPTPVALSLLIKTNYEKQCLNLQFLIPEQHGQSAEL